MARMYGPPTEAQYKKDKWKSKMWKDGGLLLVSAVIKFPALTAYSWIKLGYDIITRPRQMKNKI